VDGGDGVYEKYILNVCNVFERSLPVMYLVEKIAR
jgi:hypothetical protein